MLFELTILGCNGAVPTIDRNPTSQILNYNGQHYMFDCGEGTQKQMIRFQIKRAKLDHIFISHLHGDHYYGLIALITSFNLNHREQPLYIYGPEGLAEIINIQLKYSKTTLRFPIIFKRTQNINSEILLETPQLTIESFPLKHRIPTTGFLIKERNLLRGIIAHKITEYQIPFSEIPSIKSGKDFYDHNGKCISNAELTVDPHLPRSYAYCSDTAYSESILAYTEKVNLIYHEATFIEEHRSRAVETYHSTAIDAARIARLSKAGKLLLGHYSARYENTNQLVMEARTVFSESYASEEGQTYKIE